MSHPKVSHQGGDPRMLGAHAIAINPPAATGTWINELRKAGLLRFEDPAIVGGFWTACADT